jgi:hypothetical protein
LTEITILRDPKAVAVPIGRINQVRREAPAQARIAEEALAAAREAADADKDISNIFDR